MQWKNSELLSGLSEDDLKVIESCSSIKYFPAQEYIIRDEEEGKSFFIIEDGEVAIIKNKMLLAEKTSGNHFGFMAVIDNSPRSADVKAVTDIRVIEIDIEQIKHHNKNDLFQSILTKHFIIVQKRLRKMNEITASEMQDRLQISEEINAIRSELSNDLHDDVGSILTGIAMQSELISDRMDKSNTPLLLEKQYVDNLCSLSRAAMENMRDIVWAIDSQEMSYDQLMDRMQDYLSINLENLGIDYKFLKTGIQGNDTIDQQIKQNVYLIFKEAVANIMKHAACTYVEISLIRTEQTLFLKIKDDGTSHLKNTISGLGLKNMQARANKMTATLVFKHHEGFEINLKIPIH